MPKGIHCPHDVSQKQESLRASFKHKSLNSRHSLPSSMFSNETERASMLLHSNGPRRKSVDSPTRKQIKSTEDSKQLPANDEGIQRRASVSEKPRLPNLNKHSSAYKRHVSASEPSSSLAKKTKLDMLSKPRKDLNQPNGLSENVDNSGNGLADGEITKDRCHQCRALFQPEQILTCENAKQLHRARRPEKVKPASVGGPAFVELQSDAGTAILVKCGTKYCAKCLHSRYGECLASIRPTMSSGYVWKCPKCLDYCNCSTCRKQKGLPPTGRLRQVASQAGYSSARELLEADPIAQGADMISLANNRRQKKELDEEVALSAKDPKSQTGQPQNQKPISSKGTKSPKSKSNVLVVIPSPAKEAPSIPGREKEAKHCVQTKAPSSKSQAKMTNTGPNTVPQVSHSSYPTHPSACRAGLTGAQDKPDTPKIPIKRGPKKVPAPTCLPSIPTGHLASEQIKSRLHVREFVCRFRFLLPGLGKTEQLNSMTESKRVEQVLDSMDDIVNFWIDDEGGMRAIMGGLVRLILSEIDEEDLESSDILKSPDNHAILVHLYKETKLGKPIPSPYHQVSWSCWTNAQNFLTQEGLGDQLLGDIKKVHVTNSPFDERIARLKVSPEQKLGVITGLIDVALRGKTLAEDLVQGLERERSAKAEIVKERAKLNKKWQEEKARLAATMPPKESLLGVDAPTKGKHLQKLQEQEAERLRALEEWEAETAQADLEHKNALRLSSIAQYCAGSLNRTRFLPIGRDTRGNTYYILSSTPGRTYPKEAAELAYAWSYNLLMHGSEPSDLLQPSRKSAPPHVDQPDKARQGDPIDMLEGEQRDVGDQWMRVSDPNEIRKLAAWIEYEARLIEYRQMGCASEAGVAPGQAESAGGQVLKSVSALIEHVNTFAEYLDLKITEAADQHSGKRAVKNRNSLRAGP